MAVCVADAGFYGFDGGVYKETLTNGSYVQTLIGSGWGAPFAVAVDASGTVYVAGGGPGGVYKETPSGSDYFQTTIGSGWVNPTAIAVDGTGNLYIVDYGQMGVFQETLTNGTYTQSVIQEEESLVGAFFFEGVAVDSSRNVYVTDFYGNVVTRFDFATPPGLSFAHAAYRDPASDSTQTVTVSNLGNEDLKFSATSFPTDFPEIKGIATDCTSKTVLAGGESCTLTVDFKPAEPLGSAKSKKLQELLTVTTNTLNSKVATQKVALAGTEVPITATPVFSPPSGATFTSPRQLTITDSTPGAVIYWSNDGQDPKLPPYATNRYSGPITVDGSWTMKAIAIAPGHVQSNITTARYVYK
jgi:hypothetical protein